jgi:hypothetical protein
MEFLAIWIILAIVGAIVANNKGRSGVGWFFLCLLLTPVVILVLLALPTLKPTGARPQARPPDRAPCPWCAEEILLAARVCRFCGHELPKDWDLKDWDRREPAVGLEPTMVRANESGKRATQNLFSPGPDPAWITRFRALDPGKRVVVVCLIGASAVLVVAFILAGPSTPPPPAQNQSGGKTTAENDSCRSDWTKCADNEQLANQYSDWSLVKVRCERAANDKAKYGSPEWPWIPFGTFHRGNNYITTGIAVAIEPDAQFSNGFGAKVHSRVICTYDLRAKRVTDLQVLPR